MKYGVVVFPGTNREGDAARALEVAGGEAELVWHADDSPLTRFDGLILPGGFAHGDALRAGAIARFSPIMPRVVEFAATGRPLVGICNGFQVLLECGLLPGALQRNDSLQFRAGWVTCRVETPLFGLAAGTTIRMPIAHGQGNYLPDPERPPTVALRYVGENPNGSFDDIAGIIQGNVLGMMPHPEDAISPLLGSTDGLLLFRALTRSLVAA
jgi:phosphoribosylformylglycinamidine synthase